MWYVPHGGSTGRFSASRFGAFHYRQDCIINQTGGKGGGKRRGEEGGNVYARKPVLSSPVPCRVLVGSSIKRIDVHVLSRNPRRKRRNRLKNSRLVRSPFPALRLPSVRQIPDGTRGYIPSFRAFGTSDIRYSISRAYIHPRFPSFCSLSSPRSSLSLLLAVK